MYMSIILVVYNNQQTNVRWNVIVEKNNQNWGKWQQEANKCKEKERQRERWKNELENNLKCIVLCCYLRKRSDKIYRIMFSQYDIFYGTRAKMVAKWERETIVRCGNVARFSKGLYVRNFFPSYFVSPLWKEKETSTAVCDYWQKYTRTNMNENRTMN